jgi:hypothetical protein
VIAHILGRLWVTKRRDLTEKAARHRLLPALFSGNGQRVRTARFTLRFVDPAAEEKPLGEVDQHPWELCSQPHRLVIAHGFPEQGDPIVNTARHDAGISETIRQARSMIGETRFASDGQATLAHRDDRSHIALLRLGHPSALLPTDSTMGRARPPARLLGCDVATDPKLHSVVVDRWNLL